MLEQRWTRGIEGPILVYLRAEGSRSRTARYTASQLLPPRRRRDQHEEAEGGHLREEDLAIFL